MNPYIYLVLSFVGIGLFAYGISYYFIPTFFFLIGFCIAFPIAIIITLFYLKNNYGIGEGLWWSE
jgi:hypothetical protein